MQAQMSFVVGEGRGPPARLTLSSPSPPLPVALDSAALHAARGRYGMNDVESTTAGLLAFLRYTVLSPQMLIVLATAVYYLTVYLDGGMLLVLLVVLGLHFGVVVFVARRQLRWVTAVQRCFPHSSAVAYREGAWVLVGAPQLLPGDLLQLVQGCVVHADCTLYRGSLLLDVSSLTGHTALVQAEPGHLIKAGCTVADGSGNAVVRYTNFDTFVGQTIQLLGHLALGLQQPAVQRAYLRLCCVMFIVLVTAEVIFYGVGEGRFHWSPLRMGQEIVLLAWMCLPLNLDLAILQAVTGGATAAMTRAQAVVLRLGSLLALASVDRLVVDKSGTLTSGVCDVAAAFRSFSPHHPSRDSLVQLMALAMKWRELSTHAVRRAVLRRADLDLCDQLTLLAYVEHAGEHRTSTVLRQPDGTLLRVTEGQVSAVLALMDTYTEDAQQPKKDRSGTAAGYPDMDGDGESDGDGGGAAVVGQRMERLRECAEARQLEMVWGSRGLRTRAVAVGHETGPWRLAGLITFDDALRSDAADFVQTCAEMRVAVTIASGDAKAAVAAVAAALQLTDSTSSAAAFSAVSQSGTLASSAVSLMTGADLPTLDAWQALNASSAAAAAAAPAGLRLTAPVSAFTDVGAGGAAVYARCPAYAEMQPDHKVSLVRLLQQSGLRVGVIGDGWNDAAAAHVADVGVALVTPERGSAFPLQGALWGADVALPSTRLTAACDLIAVSRGIFATVYYLYFYVFTTLLQTVLLLLIGFTFGRIKPCERYSSYDCGAVMAPTALYLPLLIFLNVTCLFFQARQAGDEAYWTAAPCHVCYRAAALQSAAMAVVGAGAGTPLALGLKLEFFYRLSGLAYLDISRRKMVLIAFIFYVQMLASLTCASPVHCGLRFVRSRLAYLAGCMAGAGVIFYFGGGVSVSLQLWVLGYCVVVSVVQDGAKLAVHAVCYRLGCFGYRSCVDHMTGRRRRRRSRSSGHPQREEATHELADHDNDGRNGPSRRLDPSQRRREEEEGAADRADEEEEEDTRATSDSPLLQELSGAAPQASRPFSSALSAALGCLATLEERLLRVAPLRRHIAAAAEEVL